MSVRTVVYGFATATALTVAAVAVPATAHAAGGGCRTRSSGDFSLTSCISNQGSTALPDAYFNRLPSNCTGTSLQLRTTGGSLVTSASWGCTLGHEGPLPAAMSSGTHYIARACIKVSGGKFCGDSWEAWI